MAADGLHRVFQDEAVADTAFELFRDHPAFRVNDIGHVKHIRHDWWGGILSLLRNKLLLLRNSW